MKKAWKTSSWLSIGVIFVTFANFGGLLPTIEKPIIIQDWFVIGPFSAGSREGFVDPLMEWGGMENIQPIEGQEHMSWMATNGVVKWAKVQAKDGRVTYEYPNVDWDAITDQWGFAGTINNGFAYGEFQSDQPRRVLVSAQGAGSILLNGQSYLSDIYGHGYVLSPAVLKAGVNRVLIRSGRGAGALTFTLQFLPAETPVMVNARDILPPDLIEGEKAEGWAGVPLINTTPETIEDAVLTFGDDDVFQAISVNVPPLPPLSVIKLPIWVKTIRPVRLEEAENQILKVPVSVRAHGETHEVDADVRVRKAGQSYHITFRSDTDESVQKYAVLPPEHYDPAKEYALILSLHGAGVDADGLVDAYQPKDWAYVVAATNTRPFGFDWQDWGRLNVLQTLKDVKSRFKIDEDRVYLTGHSMGGHGTWHVGFTHPDLFAAIAPSAGWTSFAYYVPFTMRKGLLYAPPTLHTIWEKSLREESTLLFAENASNISVFAIEGGKDDDVPPFHPRWVIATLRDLGIEAIYHEEPGMSHWWDDPKTPGTDCVDLAELMQFFQWKKRNPLPHRVVFRTTNLGTLHRLYWVQIDEMEIPYEDTHIEARILDNGEVDVTTQNVEQFTLHLSRLLPPGITRFRINGQTIATPIDDSGSISFHRENGGFQLGSRSGAGFRKTPSLFGPIKQAYFTPFIFVYGTAGTPVETDLNRNMAVLDAQIWWWRANGFVRVISDSDVTDEIIQKYNLILYGNSQTNAILAKIQDRLPIWVTPQGVSVGEQMVWGVDLAARFLYPNPLNPQKFVVVIAGTSTKGMRLAGLSGMFYSGAGLPDFIVYGEEVKTRAWGGFLAAGFFDNSWQVSSDPRLTYFRPQHRTLH